MSQLKPMSGETLDLTKENINKLKELFPEVLTEDQIDFEKLRLILGDEVNDKIERYSFNWKGKNDAIKLAQRPSTGTLRPNKEKSKKWDDTENLYIEGDNLEVLKLLQKSYAGKIKMIYIDPPYNTGKDFVYKDNYKDNIQNYLELTNQVDTEGDKLTTNTESSGRFHTDWLNMMYPRLVLSKNLLKDDGTIFLSIDDNEQTNLKKMCDEIFGEKNFIGTLPAIMNLKGNQDQFGFAGTHEYVLVYTKNIDNAKFNSLYVEEPDELEEWEIDEIGYYKKGANLKATGVNAPRDKRPNLYFPVYIYKDNTLGLERLTEEDIEIYPFTNSQEMSWRWQKSTMQKNIQDIIVNESNGVFSLYKKQRPELSDLPSKRPKSILYKPSYSSGNGTQQIKDLFPEYNNRVFSYPKPIDFIKDLLTVGTDKDDIILDFFSGSATTAHATVQLNADDNGNRKYIMVQLPEILDSESEVHKAGYYTIPDIAIERISRAGENIAKNDSLLDGELDTGFKVFELDTSNIQKWNVDSENLEESLFSMENNFVEGRSHSDIVYEVFLKLGLDLNTPFEESIVDGSTVYDVAFGNVYIVLGSVINQEVAKHIANKQKEYENENPSVVFNDNGFVSDNEKLNSIEILKNNGFNEEQLMSI